MKIARHMGLAMSLLLLFCVGNAFANQTYMSLTFDDKAIDQPIGSGGATLGEPVFVDPSIEAIVRSTPFDTPSLELHNTHATDNKTVWFELPGMPITEGLVVIIMDLWFYGSGDGWESYWTLYNSNNQPQAAFYLTWEGKINISGLNVDATVPSYPTGRSFPVMIAFDLDADTYSAWMDGTQYVDSQPIGIPGGNFQKIWFASGGNPDPLNRVSVDQIRVMDWIPEVPVVPTTWGKVKALYR